jgi:hypothetical protein
MLNRDFLDFARDERPRRPTDRSIRVLGGGSWFMRHESIDPTPEY